MQSHHFMANRRGKSGSTDSFIFLHSKTTADGVSHKIKRYFLLGRKAMTNLDSILKKQRHHFDDKCPDSPSCVFSSSHVRMGELDHKGDLRGEELMFLNCGAGEDP